MLCTLVYNCFYNLNLLKTLGKAVLVATGVTYGVCRALDHFVRHEGEKNLETDATGRRLEGIEERLAALENRFSVLNAPELVRQGNMDAALNDLARRLDDEMDRRFEVQSRSVQSLRTMISHTGELLDQVIENIDSGNVPA